MLRHSIQFLFIKKKTYIYELAIEKAKFDNLTIKWWNQILFNLRKIDELYVY